MRVIVMDKEQSQFQTELALHQGYSMLLVGELRVTHLPLSAAPKIPSRRPIIHPFGLRYILVPPGPPGSWGSFAQALGPSYGPGYTLDTLDGVGPFTSPFAGGDDSDDGDTD